MIHTLRFDHYLSTYNSLILKKYKNSSHNHISTEFLIISMAHITQIPNKLHKFLISGFLVFAQTDTQTHTKTNQKQHPLHSAFLAHR